MNPNNIFYQVLNNTNQIALATSVDNIPNVRIVNFCFDKSRKGVLYFASDRTNKKVQEFNQNNRVAVTTVPPNGESVPHIRSTNATVKKSKFSIYDLEELFINSIEGYQETIAAIGNTLDVFEICFHEAVIVEDFENVHILKF